MRLRENGNDEEDEGTIASFYSESVFHSEGQTKDDEVENQEMFVVLDDDRPEEIEKTYGELIREASQTVMSKSGVLELERVIYGKRSVFRFWPESGDQQGSLRWELIWSERRIWVRLRIANSSLFKGLKCYFQKLVKIGFLKVCSQAAWPAAPHVGTKSSKTKLRSSIDLRLVKTATTAEKC